jgi:hypothetical protein
MQRAFEKFLHLVIKPEGERPLGRPRCKWDDIVK